MDSGEGEEDIEVRRRRLRFRAWHRGTREMDLVLGPFVDAVGAALNADELAALEALMDAPEPDAFAWIVGRSPTPREHDTPVLRRLREFHAAKGRVE
jgi:antitoxin CptB